ncbi:MAG: ATP-binding protein [Chloroflexi bacterium CFX4]|nr:ATP-binding protein [Chloroflexi bacterium CFX4]MDL1922103.1 ATP-binding protein [Chloroflexi bacterium CFX3]
MTSRTPPPSTNTLQQQAPWAPPPIRNIEDTGLNQVVIADLALKVIYFGGVLTGTRVSEIIKLPWVGVLDSVLEFLKREKLVEVKGTAGGLGEAGTQFQITGAGLVKVKEILERSQYAGAAPVTLEQYINAMKAQNRGRIAATPEVMKRALGHLVISEKMYSKVGAAVNSGKSMFLYGAPGNGKTTISEAVGRVVLGNDIWIPYAIDVDGQVIRIFDNVNHEVTETAEADMPARQVGVKRDPRWIRIRRPVIIVGGELTLDGLDLIYDPINKFYEAPYQMKCNGGMFLIDDFGRQQVRPRDLLNRWIVPLEKAIDYLTLATGRKIEIPFNVLIVFSTNIDPSDLVDEAFLRRIRHKIEVGDPTPQEFVEIFKRACQAKRVPYDENGLRYLIQEWYIKKERPFRSVHPRDILDQLLDIARYLNRPPALQSDLIDMACDSYFVQL